MEGEDVGHSCVLAYAAEVHLILLSSLRMLTASGSPELSICLFRRCLPFCFEVWHPLCYPKTRPLCQDSVKFLESKHDVSIVQVLFCWLFICILHVEITLGKKKIPNGYS